VRARISIAIDAATLDSVAIGSDATSDTIEVRPAIPPNRYGLALMCSLVIVRARLSTTPPFALQADKIVPVIPYPRTQSKNVRSSVVSNIHASEYPHKP
jgi:hypothetical protein